MIDRYTPMTYIMSIEFIETSIFTKQIMQLLDDESYRELQKTLIYIPDAGAVIPGSGGLRKIRWKGSNRGKRGGIRIIYYYIHTNGKCLMLFAYAKNVQENLTKSQLMQLSRLVEEELT